MKSSDTAEVFFDDVRVPCKNLIGQEGMGFTYQMLQFQEERLWAVANSESLFFDSPSGLQTSYFPVLFCFHFILHSHSYFCLAPGLICLLHVLL